MTQLRLHVPLSQAQDWIRDGDLLLFRRRGLIATIGRGEHSHAALAGWWGNTLCCLEVHGRYGGRVVTLASQVARFPGRIDVFLADPDDRWPEFDRQQTVQTMLQFAGRPYGYRNFVRIALRHIPGLRLFFSPQTSDTASAVGPICSEACALATRLGGGVDPVPQLADDLTEPADLARSPFYRYRATLVPDHEDTRPSIDQNQAPAERPGWLRFMTIIGILTLAFVLVGLSVMAQTTCPGGTCRIPAPVRQQPSQPLFDAASSLPKGTKERLTAATARLSNQVSPEMTVYGSAVLIARNEHRGWLLTCDHLFREGIGQVTAFFPTNAGWQGFEGRVVARDSTADLALVMIAAPEASPIPVADGYPSPGEPVILAGFGRTSHLHIVPGQVLGYVSTNTQGTRETLQITGGAQDGDSGGPIVNSAGQLVAITWGTDGFRTVGTYCGRIRAFLRAFLPRQDEQIPVAAPRSQQEESANSTPHTAPENPAQSSPEASPSRDSLLDRLHQRLESIQEKVAAAESDRRSLGDRLRTLEGALGVVTDLRQRVEKAEQIVGRENVRAVIRETAADLLKDRGPSWLNAILPAVMAALGWTGPPSLAFAFVARVALRLLERRLRAANATAQSATDQKDQVAGQRESQ